MSLKDEIKKIREQLNLHLSQQISTANLKEGGVVGKIELEDGFRLKGEERVIERRSWGFEGLRFEYVKPDEPPPHIPHPPIPIRTPKTPPNKRK